MLHELTEWLDLLITFLNKQQGPEFLRHLRRTYQALASHPQLGPILGALRGEADQIKSAFDAEHERVVKEFAALKADVVQRDPLSQILHATPPSLDEGWAAHEQSFAMFDKIVARPSPEEIITQSNTRAHKLANILFQRLNQLQYVTSDASGHSTRADENQRPDLEPIHNRAYEVNKRLNHACNVVMAYEKAAHPGFALLELDKFVAAMLLGPDAVAFTDPLIDEDKDRVANWVIQYKTIVDRIHQELRLRLGTQRSAFALLERFRGRCQWHERADLFKLAASRGGKPEDKLVSVMARWLYDQGLNPLGQASAGGLRPDLFDPSRRPAIYVEAKQYKRAPIGVIRKALGQIDDTAAQFTAEPYAIREAFLAVFRLDGRLVVPNTLVMQRGSYTLYIVVIDLKPLTKAGSREREFAVQLTEKMLTSK
jgi:hypothetical protein